MKELRPTIYAAAAFALFLKGYVNNFDKDEWIEIGAAATAFHTLMKIGRDE